MEVRGKGGAKHGNQKPRRGGEVGGGGRWKRQMGEVETKDGERKKVD